MKEFIEKLIGMLDKEVEDTYYRALDGNLVSGIKNSAYHDAIKIVNQLAEEYGKDINVTTNGWIPCSERLPEDTSFVLCTEKDTKEIYVGWHDDIEDVGSRWFDFSGFSMDVIAWQPLPAPYTKGE